MEKTMQLMMVLRIVSASMDGGERRPGRCVAFACPVHHVSWLRVLCRAMLKSIVTMRKWEALEIVRKVLYTNLNLYLYVAVPETCRGSRYSKSTVDKRVQNCIEGHTCTDRYSFLLPCPRWTNKARFLTSKLGPNHFGRLISSGSSFSSLLA
jgi:hypothetical protein